MAWLVSPCMPAPNGCPPWLPALQPSSCFLISKMPHRFSPRSAQFNSHRVCGGGIRQFRLLATGSLAERASSDQDHQFAKLPCRAQPRGVESVSPPGIVLIADARVPGLHMLGRDSGPPPVWRGTPILPATPSKHKTQDPVCRVAQPGGSLHRGNEHAVGSGLGIHLLSAGQTCCRVPRVAALMRRPKFPLPAGTRMTPTTDSYSCAAFSRLSAHLHAYASPAGR